MQSKFHDPGLAWVSMCAYCALCIIFIQSNSGLNLWFSLGSPLRNWSRTTGSALLITCSGPLGKLSAGRLNDRIHKNSSPMLVAVNQSTLHSRLKQYIFHIN